MHDDVDAGGEIDRVDFRKVAVDQARGASFEKPEVRGPAHEPVHLPALRGKGVAEMGPDEAVGAGDQD